MSPRALRKAHGAFSSLTEEDTGKGPSGRRVSHRSLHWPSQTHPERCTACLCHVDCSCHRMPSLGMAGPWASPRGVLEGPRLCVLPHPPSHPCPSCHLGKLFRQISKQTFLGLLYSLLQGEGFVSTPRCTDKSPLQDPLSPSWHKPLSSAPTFTPQAAAHRLEGPANL